MAEDFAISQSFGSGALTASHLGMMAGLGPMYHNSLFPGLPQRYRDAYFGELDFSYNNFETNDIMNQDSTIDPMAETLGEYRIFGKRFKENDRIENLLNNTLAGKGEHKFLAAMTKYCAQEGGLKNEKGKIDFANLNDPGLLFRQTRNMSITAAGSHNENMDKLAKIIVNAKNADFAAAIISEAGDGHNADDKILKAILVDSKQSMDEASYNKFVSKTAASYKKLTGESLEDFIRTQYSKDPFGFGIFGANEQGHEYLTIIDTARQKDQNLRNPMMGFGIIGIY
ncbi:MAG TPA: hypothetical protein P5556_08075 [Candidatus Gastranaerophilales bacterium]|nr:hypothetical protein [Candidatus Gastranaerophilales bacterium]